MLSDSVKQKRVVVEGITTRYFEAGTGPAVVLIHGGEFGHYTSALCWSENLPELSRHFRVLALDKLGMGYTDNPTSDAGYSMRATIDHAYNFLLRTGVGSASLIGHSRGAMVAARIAIEHPDVVKSVVIVDSNTLAPETWTWPKNFYRRFEKAQPKVPTRESALMEIRANSYSSEHVTKELADEMLDIARLPKTAEAKERMKALKPKFLRDLKRLKSETAKSLGSGGLTQRAMLVWGLNDPSSPLELGIKLYRLIASKNPTAQFHALNRSGHYSFRESPGEFNNLVATFLRERQTFETARSRLLYREERG